MNAKLNNEEHPTRRVALVTRVSTDRQASNPEGSLVTQLQRLRQHIEYRTTACDEDWTEVRVYELRGISGKYSVKSAEFAELFTDIETGRVNTVLCVALSRISRSVRDFLAFFDYLNAHGVEFVSLKEDYDTTTAGGKLLVTIMMALAEFEREQTAERTRDAMAARSERGLFNGGQLLGYDLDSERKGYLVPNLEEAAIVNEAFDAYLQCGSIALVAEALNHPHASVHYLLKNYAYTGRKVIGDRRNGHQLVSAVWPAIVDEEKFQRTQRLMATNGRTNHNALTSHQTGSPA